MRPQNDPPQNNDEPRAFDFDAQTAANVAVMKWIDSSGGLRRLVGCTPSMIVGVALHAYRESLAAKPPPPPHRMEAWVTAPSESWAALQASILDVADAATREFIDLLDFIAPGTAEAQGDSIRSTVRNAAMAAFIQVISPLQFCGAATELDYYGSN